jgi:hypothetical protein
MTTTNQQVVLYKGFNPDHVTTEPMGKNRMGGSQVMLSYMGNRPIAIQLPTMMIPFGLQEFVPSDNPSAIKYSIDLSFRQLDPSDERVAIFRSIMEHLDDQMVELACANSVEWFGKQLTKDVVRELYRPLVKQSKQPDKYEPTIKIKIREVDEDMKEYLKSGSTMKTIVEFAPVWFLNRQFGVNFNLVNYEIITQSTKRAARVYDFVDDEDN